MAKPLPTLPAFKSAPKTDENELFVYSADSDEASRVNYKPKTQYRYGVAGDEFDVEFQRKDVKDVIHIITSEIKRKGTKTPYLLLPFRPQQHDSKLKAFLKEIFDHANLADEQIIKSAAKRADEFVLVSALKFFWCRLPGNCVIGWKTYTKFVTLDEEAGFPKRAFLEFMPSCLSSGAHASIVYDFFDLIVALTLNSKQNMLSAKKIARLCGLWAFHSVKNNQAETPSFERGMYEWIPAGDATFHLLLSFLNTMPPKGQVEKLPRALQQVLKSTPYPPPPTSKNSGSSSRFLQEVPMVTIKVNNPSKNPAELLVRVSKTLKFNDPAVFYTREDYLLLKRLFKDPDGLISKLSSEGSRLLDNMCLYDEDMVNDGNNGDELAFKLVPGWSEDMTTPKPVELMDSDYFVASVSRATIDDYFIWTWLSSLGSEETSLKKKMFGKTYIMEVELAEGFKKWVIVEEQDVERDGYDIEIELKKEKLKDLQDKIRNAEKEVEQLRVANRTRVISESKDLADITNRRDEPLPDKPNQNSPLPAPPPIEKDLPPTPNGKENHSPISPRERAVKANSASSYYTAVQTPSPMKDDRKAPPMGPIHEQHNHVSPGPVERSAPPMPSYSSPQSKRLQPPPQTPPQSSGYQAPVQSFQHAAQPATQPIADIPPQPAPQMRTLRPRNEPPRPLSQAASGSPLTPPMSAFASEFEQPKRPQSKRNSKIIDDIESLESQLMGVLHGDEDEQVAAETKEYGPETGALDKQVGPQPVQPVQPEQQTNPHQYPRQYPATAQPAMPRPTVQSRPNSMQQQGPMRVPKPVPIVVQPAPAHAYPPRQYQQPPMQLAGGFGVPAPSPAYASSARSRSSSPMRYGQRSSPSPERIAQSPYGSPGMESRGRQYPMPQQQYPQYLPYPAQQPPHGAYPPAGYAYPYGAPAAPAPAPYGGSYVGHAPPPAGFGPRHKANPKNKNQARNALMNGDFGI
ncbi:hypothetical protein OGAPHI_006094 [Ogataea philodendri]|uniref:Meiotically up-regulated protein Msb1/Mug8 domain-containing protein n=1 Tax=Ogataea philodendri TaxID=1378263 RepID=A0A9P8NYN0_9ASCO|nr:uncharacterized protein OGAPHI_006094 [Ogataea philodendri]KAH3661915.1 hypothetical protein OGAPHI_006094 [Ogataea philodendri]